MCVSKLDKMPNEVKLRWIKDGIRKNHAVILEKWTYRVQNRPPNLSELTTYVMDQYNLAGAEMMRLMVAVFSFLDYKSMHAFGKDFRDVAQRIEEQLRGRKFYLIMECMGESSLHRPVFGGPSEDKSNYFMFVLLMCIRPGLIDQLVDFVCTRDGRMTPVHTELNKDVGVCVFMDDVAFTGTQAVQNTYIEHPSDFELIYGSVYASEEALRYLEHSSDEYAGVSMITSDFKPRPMTKNLVTEKYLSSTSTPMDDELRHTALRTLGMLTDEHKYLFYTDLKIPDQLSMYTKILPQTRLIGESGRFEGWYDGGHRYKESAGYNFSEGGHYEFDSEVGRFYGIIDTREKLEDPRNWMDDEVYKTKSWMAFTESLKKYIYSRKRSRSGNLVENSPYNW